MRIEEPGNINKLPKQVRKCILKEGEKGKIISNSNPFSNLDTSSPKVNHSHVLKVAIHMQGCLFSLGLAPGLLTLPPHPLKELSPCVKTKSLYDPKEISSFTQSSPLTNYFSVKNFF